MLGTRAQVGNILPYSATYIMLGIGVQVGNILPYSKTYAWYRCTCMEYSAVLRILPDLNP